MESKTSYLENAILDHVLGKGDRDLLSPALLYLALHTENPTEAGNVGELIGNGYVRQPITFDAAAGSEARNGITIVFEALGDDWGLVTHASLWDAEAGGNPLYFGPLTTPRFVADGDPLQFNAGSVRVYES